MDSVITPWTVELALITWRSVRKKSRPPLPSEFLATFVVFGGFTVVSRVNPRIGAGLGWGIVIATFLNLYGTEDKLTTLSIKAPPTPPPVPTVQSQRRDIPYPSFVGGK